MRSFFFLRGGRLLCATLTEPFRPALPADETGSGPATTMDRAMSNNSDIVFPPAARRAQAERGSTRAYEKRIAAGFPDRVTAELASFIAQLDTAFPPTVSADGAPYI